MSPLCLLEYERLKAESNKKVEEDKLQQLQKLKKDLGEGKDVPMTSPLLSTGPRPHGISLGAGVDSDDDDDDTAGNDDDDDDVPEAESFQRYLKQFKSEEQKTDG